MWKRRTLASRTFPRPCPLTDSEPLVHQRLCGPCDSAIPPLTVAGITQEQRIATFVVSPPQMCVYRDRNLLVSGHIPEAFLSNTLEGDVGRSKSDAFGQNSNAAQYAGHFAFLLCSERSVFYIGHLLWTLFIDCPRHPQARQINSLLYFAATWRVVVSWVCGMQGYFSLFRFRGQYYQP